MTIETHTGEAIKPLIPDLAALRIEVFREWPYLYDGDQESEDTYLRDFASAKDAIVVSAREGVQIVGAATGSALAAHHDEFAAPIDKLAVDPSQVFYCAESVLRATSRGQGFGHAFFDAREAHARACGYAYSCFCAVVRPDDHPLRPEDPRSLAPFWSARGYAPVSGAVAQFSWRDVGQSVETEKALQFWMRSLD